MTPLHRPASWPPPNRPLYRRPIKGALISLPDRALMKPPALIESSGARNIRPRTLITRRAPSYYRIDRGRAEARTNGRFLAPDLHVSRESVR